LALLEAGASITDRSDGLGKGAAFVVRLPLAAMDEIAATRTDRENATRRRRRGVRSRQLPQPQVDQRPFPFRISM